MYPPQTSLIPIAVALTKFLEANSLSALFSWYPYWYLGVPFGYITGPIIPITLFGLHKIFPAFDLFTLSFVLIGISYLIGIMGWMMFFKKICKPSAGNAYLPSSTHHLPSATCHLPSTNYHLLFIFLAILPWRLFSSITMGETSFTISRNLLPWVLVACYLYLTRKTKWGSAIAILASSLILLISTDILPILLIGFISLVLALSFKDGKIKGLLRRLKQVFLLFFISLVLVTFVWYTPGYFITIFSSPSLGGLSLGRVIIRVMDLLRGFIPVLLAILTVYLYKKINWNKLTVFTFSWTLSFLFITIYRFFSDINFWMDWTTWFYELEIGLALIGAQILNSKFEILNESSGNQKPHLPSATNAVGQALLIYYLLLLILPFYFVWRINISLGKPTLFSKDVPEGIENIDKIAEIVRGSRVFMSGSTVFWSGSLGEPINQLRGGNDKVSTNPLWHHGAYQIREGSDPELSRAWLEVYGIEYVLVHTPGSEEYYHDYKNISKWKTIGNIIWEGYRDYLVKVGDFSDAYKVDAGKLESVKKLKKGDDLDSLKRYLSVREGTIVVKRSYNEVILSPNDFEIGNRILLLESFNKHWKTNNGSISKDIFGNMIINPDHPGDIVITYK